MSASSSIPVEKLRGQENYSSWKFTMKMLLIHEELWDCVDPGNDTIDDKKQQKALAKICLAVQPTLFSLIINCKTAKEAWDNLKKAYQETGLTRRLGLLRQLFASKLASNMDEYLNKILDISQQLQEIESPMDSEFIAVVMLSGLSPDYDPLIMALENSNMKLTSDIVKNKLLQEYHRRTAKTDETVSALTVKKQIRCYRCKKTGHYMKNCPNKNVSTQKFTHTTKSKPEALLTALSASIASDAWYIDSGASNHMCNNRAMMDVYTESNPSDVCIANGEKIQTTGLGQVQVQLKDKLRTISDVHHVPKLAANLLSVSAMVKKGYKVIFDHSGCHVYNKNNEVLASAHLKGGVYQLDTKERSALLSKLPKCDQPLHCVGDSFTETSLVTTTGSKATQEVWHRRLGHLNARSMYLLKQGMATNIDYDLTEFKSCIQCVEGKQSRCPFPKKTQNRSTVRLGIVHSDVCGPMPEKSFSGARYFLTFIDDFTRKTFIYFLKSKSEVFEKFKLFKAEVENETNQKIKILRSDNGGEYISSQFQNFLAESGIKHQTTIPHSPAQNGVAERANRTIVEKARCLLQDAGLEQRFWAEAVNTAVYLKNRSPTKAVPGVTPEEKWSGKKVNLDNLRIFGCLAYSLVKNRTKFDSKSKKYIFVGYCELSKGYRLIDPLNPTTCIKSRDVIFLEDHFYSNKNSEEVKNDILNVNTTQNINIMSNEQQQTDHSTFEQSDSPNDDIVSRHRISERQSVISIGSNSYESGDSSEEYLPGESSLQMLEEDEEESTDDTAVTACYAGLSCDGDDPGTVSEALSSSEAEQWTAAMKDEYQSFIDNNCWTMTDLPKGQKPIKCKWVFKKKRGLDGKLLKYKARLVAKGYTQKYGIDYEETFSPVVRYSTIRTLLAIAAEYDMDIDHMDVKTAFLNGDLKETIFMEQPEYFKVNGSENKVYKLNKSIYGLKQASRAWYEKINSVLLNKLNFKQLTSEPCVYFASYNGEMIIIALYVDDILLFTHQNSSERIKIKEQLMREFKITDLGPVRHILGMSIQRSKGGEILLDQSTYINKVLQRFNMTECRPAATPMEAGLKLVEAKDQNSNLEYRNLIGCLMYIAVCSRPDISHAVSVLSQFNNCYSDVHWKAAKRVLRYLKGTINYALVYKKSGLDTTCYVDADWAGSSVDRKSYTGFIFQIGSSTVSWESRKQRTVALSSTEAEYMAIADACKEALFLRKVLFELLGKSITISMYNDNQSSQKLCRNNMFHSRTKHIDVRHDFVKQIVKEGIVNLEYLSTDSMTADILTKPLTKCKHNSFVKDMNFKF